MMTYALITDPGADSPLWGQIGRRHDKALVANDGRVLVGWDGDAPEALPDGTVPMSEDRAKWVTRGPLFWGLDEALGATVLSTLDGTIADLTAWLATGAGDDVLDSVKAAEKLGKNRVGALEAIDDREASL